ncbi:hypothetical protein B7760_00240 [Burkholderia glumae]|nr:hypothetical protein B7760_00240 [Burkholderia glumae]
MIRPKASWLSFGAFLFDVLAVAAAWLVSYLVRFNGEIPLSFSTAA